MINKNIIYQGNTLDILKSFPDNQIDCIITSPPYYRLRSYQTTPQIWGGNLSCNHVWNYNTKKGISGGIKSEKVHVKDEVNFQIVPDSQYGFCEICGAWLGELGQEPSPALFISHLQMIFSECMRVLKPTGSLWINIADSYSGNATMPGSSKQASNRGTNFIQTNKGNIGIPKKSLIGIPDRLKISMIDNGFICRQEIVWRKPNQMPQSAKDRFTNDFEKLYWFVKSPKYYFEQQFESYKSKENHVPRNKASEKYIGTGLFSDGGRDYYSKGMRNKRTVWDINTEPNRESHFATFPTKLVESMLIPTCPENGIVLDPFFGSGTTGLVAKRNNRNYIGIELNSDYVSISNNRLVKE